MTESVVGQTEPVAYFESRLMALPLHKGEGCAILPHKVPGFVCSSECFSALGFPLALE